MMNLTRMLRMAAYLIGSFAFAIPAHAAQIKSQQPCAGDTGACLAFSYAGTIPDIRSITFDAPGPGTASASFHGTLYCAAIDTLITGTRAARVDLVSQIVTNQTHVPDYTKPGGLRHAAGLVLYSTAPVFDLSNTFNLASTRTVNVKAAGKQKFYFKIERLLQDAGVTCYVYNAVFTVLFVP